MISKRRTDHSEGAIARTIEDQTARLPSETFLAAAMLSIIASASLHLFGRTRWSMFVGQWVSTLLLLGIYNKLVKQLGHDKNDRGR